MNERATADPGRDPLLDRVYAGTPREEPPAALDDAIRAAARREVGSRPRSLRAALRAWRMPVSLAAVVVLSVSVVLLMKEEGADRLDAVATQVPRIHGMAVEEARPPAPAASPAPLPAPKKDEAGARRDSGTLSEAPSSDDALRRKAPASGPGDPGATGSTRSAVRQSAPLQSGADLERARAEPEAVSPAGRLAKEAQSAQELKLLEQRAPASAQSQARGDAPQTSQAKPFSDQPAAKPAPQRELSAPRSESDAVARASEDRQARSAPESTVRREAIPAPPPAKSAVRGAAPAAVASAPREPVWTGFERQPPEKWVERIEELRRAGQPAAAREMLDELKRRFPDFPVPASLAP